ncbi:unnamed protein product [Hyaloperonospora brassicae]|uniref:ethanolamine kinase n=1 Tax=Hyaloperonospora brassicae TaxID=162125 RepID=A0AAV0TAL8_HYABA|nr:unnamed protein product [Hyaloperonospora brassicae]
MPPPVARPTKQYPNWPTLALVSAATCALTVAGFLLVFDRRSFRLKRRFGRYRSRKRLSDSRPRFGTSDVAMSKDVIYLNNANACLDYVVGAGDTDEFSDAKSVVKQICLDWRDAENDEIAVKIIVGGITNRLYRLLWQNKSVLVRLYGDHTEEFIDRDAENVLFALLSERGFAPTYYGRFKNGRIEGWLDARPLLPEEMGQTKPVNYVQMIGRELGVMHVMDILEDRAPVLWTKIERFEKLAMAIKLDDPVKNAALQEVDLAKLHQKLQWLKSVLPSSQNRNGKDLLDVLDTDAISAQAEAFASDVVFSHNDLLSGNILHNSDWDRVQIIDYEYGGYNYRAFDFANHFCENCGFELDLALYPSMEKQFAFFKAYMSTAAPNLLAELETNRESKAFFHALYDVVNRYALASHLFWGYWAVVQAAHSTIDFDFLAYAAKRFNTFDVHRDVFFSSN